MRRRDFLKLAGSVGAEFPLTAQARQRATPIVGVRRREFIAVLGGAAAWPLRTHAQQGRIARIGFLTPASATGFQVKALRAGLQDYGYVEGKNVAIEYRYADGKFERLQALANELVSLKVDVIVTHSTPGTQAVKNATTTIPIVMALAGDAIAIGLVDNLARPSGNVTGSTFFSPELMAKRLELLHELQVPMTRIAVLLKSGNAVNKPTLQAMSATANALKMELLEFYVQGRSEFESTFATIAEDHVDAVVINDDPILIVNANELASLLTKRHLSSVGYAELAVAGGLMGYGINFFELFRRSGYFVDRILRGAKPGELPVERPTKFDLVINLGTAKTLGLDIPLTLLGRADKVLE